MNINVLHFAITPLAGSPIRIINALNNYTSVKARLVTLNPNAYGARVFDNDLCWETDKDQIMDILEETDIIHLHHFFDLNNNPFGLKFLDYYRKGKKIIRQFHSTPMHISKYLTNGKYSEREIVESEIPQLVIPHYPERFYPRARVVPNIVPIHDDLYKSINGKEFESIIKIFYGPSLLTGAWEERWDTKGAPETKILLDKLSKYYNNVQIHFVHDKPHYECLKDKQKCQIAIDEMVTGSFHLSSLESLSQGIPTFAFLDHRTLWNIEQLTGNIENPWLNFRLEEAEKVFHRLITDKELRKEIGIYSRSWMEKYWDDKRMVLYYVDAYKDLLENPDSFMKLRFDLNNKRDFWFVEEMDDQVWKARSKSAFEDDNNKERNGLSVENLSNSKPADSQSPLEINERMKKYYKLLNKWLKLQQNNHNLSEILIKNGFRKIAIYGCGEIGKNLLEELKETKVEVSCFLVTTIDSGVHTVKQVKVDEFKEYQKVNKIDAIIVTPIYDYENIRNVLIKEETTCSILSLEELIDEFIDELDGACGLVEKIKKLEQRVTELSEKINIIEAIHPQTLWLYKNAIERMDANVELFDPLRRHFHKARYYFALDFVEGKNVADIACGTGYGTEMLKVYGKANNVTGVDVSQEAINYATLNHKAPGINYLCASGDQTDLDSESIDVVVSFETLEHVPDDYALLKEFHRLLKDDGVLVCSVPNNWDVGGFHLRSYDRVRFENVLKIYFKDIVLYNQNSGKDSAPYNRGQSAGICLTTSENENLAECYIAVCKKK